MEIDFERIGMCIKTTRKRKKLTQAELAEQVGISTTYLSLIETAKKRVSLFALVQLSKALEITMDELLWGSGILRQLPGSEAWNLLLSDCTCEEQEILLTVSQCLKRSLRQRIL